MARCLVAVKEKEIKPRVLLKMIKVKRPRKIKILDLEFFNETENSIILS